MKLKMYAYFTEWTDEPTVCNFPMTASGYVPAGEYEVDLVIERPSLAEINAALVADLRRQQGKLVAEATAIEARIRELLCIEGGK